MTAADGRRRHTEAPSCKTARLARRRAGCARCRRPVICPPFAAPGPRRRPRRAACLGVVVPRGTARRVPPCETWRRAWTGASTPCRRRVPRAPSTACPPPRPSTQAVRRCAPSGPSAPAPTGQCRAGRPSAAGGARRATLCPSPNSPPRPRATVAGHDAHVLRLLEVLAMLMAAPHRGIGLTLPFPRRSGASLGVGRKCHCWQWEPTLESEIGLCVVTRADFAAGRPGKRTTCAARRRASMPCGDDGGGGQEV